MTASLLAAHWSGSSYVAAASRVLAIMFVGSIILWFTGRGVWRYAVLELFALVYFYLRWSARDAQHRQFHFFLMCTFMATTAFYAYRLAVQPLLPGAFAMSPWWYQLAHNILFLFELFLVVSYAFLYRRARADRRRYYEDVDSWFDKAGAFRRNAASFLRGLLLKKRKR